MCRGRYSQPLLCMTEAGENGKGGTQIQGLSRLSLFLFLILTGKLKLGPRAHCVDDNVFMVLLPLPQQLSVSQGGRPVAVQTSDLQEKKCCFGKRKKKSGPGPVISLSTQ